MHALSEWDAGQGGTVAGPGAKNPGCEGTSRMELDILIMAGVAVFVLYRLYLVLGTKTGHERPPERLPDNKERKPSMPAGLGQAPVGGSDNVIPMPRQARAGSGAKVADAAHDGVAAITRVDPTFDPAKFIEGAKMAHEMIVDAFAAGDRQALRPLLADDVYQSFEGAIQAREAAGHRAEVTVVGAKPSEIVDAQMRQRIAEVTVKFVSEMVSVTRDAAGAIVDGAAGVVREVTDIWTFARDTRSHDPNWKLVATATE